MNSFLEYFQGTTIISWLLQAFWWGSFPFLFILGIAVGLSYFIKSIKTKTFIKKYIYPYVLFRLTAVAGMILISQYYRPGERIVFSEHYVIWIPIMIAWLILVSLYVNGCQRPRLMNSYIGWLFGFSFYLSYLMLQSMCIMKQTTF